MGICKVIFFWNLISNEWFFMWNKWLVLKKKGRERKKDMIIIILNCKENVNGKKNLRWVLYVIRRKECMWLGEKKRGLLFYFYLDYIVCDIGLLLSYYFLYYKYK